MLLLCRHAQVVPNLVKADGIVFCFEIFYGVDDLCENLVAGSCIHRFGSIYVLDDSPLVIRPRNRH